MEYLEDVLSSLSGEGSGEGDHQTPQTDGKPITQGDTQVGEGLCEPQADS